MNRRGILGLIGLSPLALAGFSTPTNGLTAQGKEDPILASLIKRWDSCKAYTQAIFEAMPAEDIEYAATEAQLSFAQHFLHIGFTNNMYIGVMLAKKTYKDFNALQDAPFFLERPDPINLFQPDQLQKRDPEANKALVIQYLTATFDYVIASIHTLNDGMLTQGADKVKPAFLSGHTNLDLILRGETHTTHHRAQAIGYLRLKGIRPPAYTPFNTL